MSQVTIKSGDTETLVDLKSPAIAALLAFLVPGAGHLYQGRSTKGFLFMVCILTTFFYGLILGDGKVVYAHWDPRGGQRAITQLFQPFICQMFVGLPALPAFVERMRANEGKPPLFGIMVPPQNDEELASWHKDLGRHFELGTVYTMIAGLLNILVIYDAWGGPMQYLDEKKVKKDSTAKTVPDGQLKPG